MSTIKITPEQLHHVSTQVEQARQQLEQIRGELTRQIMFVRMMWTGATQERFFYEFERSGPILDKALESMVNTSKELKVIATRFEDADAQSVSLGGAAGAVGAAAMMTNSSGTGSGDKGYRMAHVNFYGRWMWLPVNENGVADQASLQAYEKDQGHLDFNKMQAVNVEPPGEDIFALQIKAFELGIDPFSGRPVSEDYAKWMVISLKAGQIFMGFQMIRGSIPGRQGPLRLPSSHSSVKKMKGYIEEAEKAKRKSSEKAGSANGGNGETGTVWDNIKGTQPNNPGTNIPKSFEVSVNGEKYWVNPNATKHMVEYSTRTISHGQKLTEQQLLTSFQSSVKEATRKGYKFNEPIVVSNWELIFSPSREAGQLPVIKHALYIP
ncbi:WXG100 family type VII secretion target [Paenibacillus sp. DCT19]|uniref:WXG100 family type VII secretion target n=1 Tax=Paenibacillus sp. DCT19 TaxID=2211212 RepID=UPI000FE25A73|nr:WXG100 family type VII secretion target [Paenibacillus sp. DCT19]